jgi:hypothetical protein
MCAVFLHFVRLESNFTHHWPPSIALREWMVVCKECEVTGEDRKRVSTLYTVYKRHACSLLTLCAAGEQIYTPLATMDCAERMDGVLQRV